MTALDDRLIAPAATTFPPRHGSSLSSEAAAAWFATAPRAIPARQIRVALTDDWGNELSPAWLGMAVRRVNQLLTLEPGWDGHRARALSDAAISSLFEVLAVVMSDDVARPQIFPLVDGGLQAEWHAGGHDIEVEIESDGSIYAIARTPDGEYCVDEDVAPPRPTWDQTALNTLVAVQKSLGVLTQVVNDAAYA